MHKKAGLILKILLAVCVVLYTAVRFTVPRFMPELKNYAENYASDYIKGSINIGDVEWNGALTLKVKDISICDEKEQLLFSAPETSLGFNPVYLLTDKSKVLSSLDFSRPEIYIRENRAGRWNFSDLMKPSDTDKTPFYGSIYIEKGGVHLFTPEGNWDFLLTGAVSGSDNPDFRFAFSVSDEENEEILFSGIMNKKLQGRVQSSGSRLQLDKYASLIERYSSIKNSSGALKNYALEWSDKGEGSLLNGEAELVNLKGTYNPASLENTGNIVSVNLSGKVKFKDRDISTDGLDITLNGQTAHVAGHCLYEGGRSVKGKLVAFAEKVKVADVDAKNVFVKLSADGNKLLLEKSGFDIGEGHVALDGAWNMNDGDFSIAAAADNLSLNLPQGKDALLDAGFVATGNFQSKDDFNFAAAAESADVKLAGKSFKVVDWSLEGDQNGVELNSFTAMHKKGYFYMHGSLWGNAGLKLNGGMADFPLDEIFKMAGEEGECDLSSYIEVRNPSIQSAGDIISSNILRESFLKAGFFADRMSVRAMDFHDLSGNIEMDGKKVYLEDVKLYTKQGMHKISADMELADEHAIEAEVVTENVRIEPIVASFDSEHKLKLTGNLNNSLKIGGTLSSPYFEGRIHMEDGSAYGYLVDSVKGAYTYVDGKLHTDDLKIKAISTYIDLSGDLQKNGELQFAVNAKDIDLSKLPIRDAVADIDGVASLKGYLEGTLTAPVFSGDIKGENIGVNGEVLSSLAGRVTSNGAERNILQAIASQEIKEEPVTSTRTAMYYVDLSLDLPAKKLKGSVGIKDGSLQNFLKMMKKEIDVDGRVNGNVYFCKPGTEDGVTIDTVVDKLRIHDLHYKGMTLKAHMRDKVLYLDKVRMQQENGTQSGGFIALGGKIDFAKESCKLEAGAISADPGLITAFMERPLDVEGTMDIIVQVAGPWKNLKGNGSITINNGNVEGMDFNQGTAMLILQDDNLHLEQMLLQKGDNKITAAGDIPLDLFRRNFERRHNNAQMDINVDFGEAGLQILNALKIVEWGQGNLEGAVKVKGTLEKPLVFGKMGIRQGALKLKPVRTIIENINSSVLFKGNEVEIENISCVLGKGGVEGKGSYQFRASGDDAYLFTLQARNAEIKSSLFKGRINGIMEITPEAYTPNAEEEAVISANLIKHIVTGNVEYRPKITANVRLDDVLVNMPTIPSFESGDSNVGLDIIVKTGPKVHLFNKYLYDMWLDGDIRILGSSRFTVINGMVTAKKGTVTYLRTPFKIDKAYVVWPNPGDVLPNVYVKADTRFSQYRIALDVTGPLMEMRLQLHSDPPLTKDELVRMLTLQRVSVGDGSVTDKDLQNLLNAGLQMELLGDVERMVKQISGIDEFKIYSGRVENGVDFDNRRLRELTPEERSQYNFLVAKNLTPGWKVGYTRSFDGKSDNIYTQYVLSDRLDFTISHSRESENRYSIEYRVNY